MLMGVATTLMGLLPTFESIGICDPAPLLRILQGLGAGAEFGGAVVMAAEYSPWEGADSSRAFRAQGSR